MAYAPAKVRISLENIAEFTYFLIIFSSFLRKMFIRIL